MLRRIIAACAVAVAAVAAVAPAPAAAGPRDDFERRLGEPPARLRLSGGLGHEWRGDPPYEAGAVVVDRGELIVNDAPFDDTGADTVPGNGEGVGRLLRAGTLPLCSAGPLYRNGDARYPSEPRYGANAADLVELRIAADASAYYVLFLLETLLDAGTTAVALGIDADRDAATGRPGWPGFEHVLEIGRDGARLDGRPVESRVDVGENTFQARIPRAAVGDGVWRVAAVVGLSDGTTMTRPMDLAFVPDEVIVGTDNCWHEKRQSELLARGERPAVDVDTVQLRRRESDARPVRRGPMVRLYPPRAFADKEGTVGQPRYDQESSNRIYWGRLQPYTVYVPSSYDPGRPNPLIVLLHCLNCNHNIFHIAAWPGLRDLAESRGAPIVTPFGFGEGGHYEAEAEIDVFEVLSDVTARYRIDLERVYLTGMSMGALGTFRLGSLYPDLWARAFGVGVYTTPYCVTVSPTRGGCQVAPFNYFHSLESFRNIPFGIVNGGLDELTPVTGSREIAARFAELGYAYRYWEYPTRAHEPSLHGLTTDVTDPFLGDARRVRDPARVTYVIDRTMWDVPLGIVHDRAYWLRDLRVAEGVRRATVDATSGRGRGYTTTPVSGQGSSAAGPYTMVGLDPVPVAASGANELGVVSRGLSSVTVRADDAGLSRREPLSVRVDTDVPLELRVAGWATKTLPPGVHAFVLGAQAGTGPSGVLPATGSSTPLALAAAAGVAALAARRLAGR